MANRIRLSPKDTAGLLLVAGTLGVLILHGNEQHQRSHTAPVVDAGGAVTSADPARSVAFVDVHVVPMSGAPVASHQVVIVRDGVISRIGPVGVLDVPPEAQIVEGSGSEYLMPGLVDAHVHLPEARTDVMPLFLANGVTTVFNLEGDARHLELRRRSREAGFAGPTVYTSGPFVDALGITTAAGARTAVIEQAEAGYDFVKLHGQVSRPVYEALLATADSVGVAVVGHAPRNLPFPLILEQGQAGIVHAEELLYTVLQSLDVGRAHDVGRAMAEADVWLTPALTTFQSITDQWASPAGLEARMARPETRWLPPALRRAWETSDPWVGRPTHERERIEAMNAFHGPLVRALYEEGVPLLAGTDTPMPGVVPGFSLHDELDALLAAGVPREAVLAAATSRAGTFVREHVDPDARFGRLEEGQRADLVLSAGNPLDDLATLRNPIGVMARGTWYPRDELRRMVELAAQPSTAVRN